MITVFHAEHSVLNQPPVCALQACVLASQWISGVTTSIFRDNAYVREL
jgi:hypothetical protein